MASSMIGCYSTSRRSPACNTSFFLAVRVFACRVVLCEQSSTKLDHFNLTRKMHTLSPQALSHTSSPTTHATQLHLSYLTHKAAYLSYLTHNTALW